jgi:hypothetical protein
MMIARWQIQARFGHKEAAIALMHRWWQEIAPRIGWTREQMRLLTGALGERESAIDVEVEIEDLAALNEAWARLARAEGQEQWSAELEPHVVSGTSRWTVHRIL